MPFPKLPLFHFSQLTSAEKNVPSLHTHSKNTTFTPFLPPSRKKWRPSPRPMYFHCVSWMDISESNLAHKTPGRCDGERNATPSSAKNGPFQQESHGFSNRHEIYIIYTIYICAMYMYVIFTYIYTIFMLVLSWNYSTPPLKNGSKEHGIYNKWYL